MTSIESLVTSLDRSRQLKEAGCPSKSVFFWHVIGDQAQLSHAINIGDIHDSVWDSEFSAYTAEELLRLLPPGCRVYRPGVHTNEWLAEAPGLDLMEEGDDGDLPNWTGAESAANSLAKLYLALQKKHLL